MNARKNIVVQFILLTFALLGGSQSSLGQEYTSLPLGGSDIAIGNSISLDDPICNGSDCSPYTICNYQSYVRLEIGPLNPDVSGVGDEEYTDNLHTVTVTYDLDYTDVNGVAVPTLTNQTLEVEFNPSGGVAKNIDMFLREHMYDMLLTVKDVDVVSNVMGAPTTLEVPTSTSLSIGFITDRFTSLTTNTISSSVVQYNILTAEDNDIQFSWNINDPGIEEYELEWTWIDGDLESFPAGPISFQNNATRVKTKSSQYTISNIYRNGFIIARIRVIGRDACDHIVYSPWSSSPVYNGGLQITDGHNENLNWQHSRVYAEDAKKKDVIGYFDGSLRSRQNVTKLEDENHIIISESYYDHVGRPVVQVLPSPLLAGPNYENKLDFYAGFSQNNGSQYDRSHFESDGDCESSALALDNSAGSGQYYSSGNTITDGHQAYVPDAEGYPLSQTIYTQDATGRVRAQGGVGPTHQIGGKDTKYYYAVPSQEQLDRLFGNDVGYNNYYQEQTVVDPNGQVSVSYLDNKGRVIATALAGAIPEGLSGIDGSGNSESFSDELHLLNEPVDYPSAEAVLVVNKSTVVKKNGTDYNYTHTLLGNNFKDADCLPSEIEFECKYDLEITVFDECNVNKYNYAKSNFNTHNESLFGPTLDLGSYNVNKVLSLNQESMQTYQDQYVEACQEHNVCIENEITIFNSLINGLDATGCNIDQACFDNCYNTIVLTDYSDDLEGYKAALIECAKSCDEANPVILLGDCDKMYRQMLRDVSPHGQYGQVINGDGQILEDREGLPCTSIYSTNNIFFDAAGTCQSNYNCEIDFTVAGTELTVDIDGEIKSVNSLTHVEFVSNFQPEWAEALVTRHPEYCLYEWCANQGDSDWEIGFLEEENQMDAKNFGYLNPTGISHPNILGYGSFIDSDTPSAILLDPYFIGTDIETDLVNYASIEVSAGNFISYSIWDVAYIISLSNRADIAAILDGPNPPQAGEWPTLFGDGLCYSNRFWQSFKGLYSRLKNDIKYQTIPSNLDICATIEEANDLQLYSCIDINSCGCPATSAESDIMGNPWEFITPVFVNLADPGVTDVAGVDLNNIPTDSDFVEDYVDDGLAPDLVTHCQETCESYIANWEADLSNCHEALIQKLVDLPMDQGAAEILAQSKMDDLISSLQTICESGCDATHPLGSSSSKDGMSDFQSEISQFLSDNGIIEDFTCNGYVISYPLPYGNDMFGGQMPFYDDCTCSRYNQIHDDYKLTDATPTIAEFHTYLQIEYNLDNPIDDIIDIDCGCNPDNAIVSEYALDTPTGFIFIPEPFACVSCLTCDQIAPLYGDFLTSLPLGTVLTEEDLYNSDFREYIANWFNVELGFNLSSGEYIDFLNNCSVSLINSTAVSSGVNHAGNDIDLDIPIAPDDYPMTVSSDVNFSLEFSSDFIMPGNPLIITYSIENLSSSTVTFENFSDTFFPGWTVTSVPATIVNGIPLVISNGGNTISSSGFSLASGQLVTFDVRLNSNANIYLIKSYYAQAKLETTAAIIYSNDDPSEIGAQNPTEIFIKLDDPCNGNVATPEDFLLFLNELNTELDGVTLSSTPLTFNLNVFSAFDANHSLNIFTTTSEDNLTINISESEQISIVITDDCGDVFDVCEIMLPVGLDFAEVKEFSSVHPVENASNGDHQIAIGVLYKDDTEDVLIASSSCYPLKPCEEFTLCNRPLYFEAEIEDDCLDIILDLYAMEATATYIESIDNSIERFQIEYPKQCMNYIAPETADDLPALSEIFTENYSSSEYQHTLYYYDQSGSLVRTVPPEGVNYNVNLNDVKAYRNDPDDVNNTATYPDHRMVTNYEYNSYNQVVAQNSPDADEQQMWYDRLGRVVMSQDGRQRGYDVFLGSQAMIRYAYSYTLYDEQSRIIETGELYYDHPEHVAMTDETASDPSMLADYIANADGKQDVVKSIYDISYDVDGAGPLDDVNTYFDNDRRYLRKRISSILYYGDKYYESQPENYTHACHYDYDVHGNVKTLINEFAELKSIDQHLKRIDYDYDLISGNVLKVNYQAGALDQFYHRYTYDADNRITGVETSYDDIIWQRDAAYEYYDHGPLARAELGEHNVQGIDYAYTIHGWIKGVNSNTLKSTRDIGKDGENNIFPEDAYGYSLGYYSGDYKAIAPSDEVDNFVAAEPDASTNTFQELYNGNISRMVTAIRDLNGAPIPNQPSVYTYDQLHRIQSMQKYDVIDQLGDNTWSSSSIAAYKTEYTYDLNGNIEILKRNDGSGQLIDDLSYNYNKVSTELINNKLRSVSDLATNDIDESVNDLRHQTAIDNYSYDNSGNLIKDLQEKIQNINWNHFGKINYITRFSSADLSNNPEMYYRYDAMGNRIVKIVKNGSNSDDVEYTLYSRDASGNVMATYKGVADPGSSSLKDIHDIDELYLSEQHLYGSSRLGIKLSHIADVDLGQNTISDPVVSATHLIGQRYYHLSNHLGNVLSTVSDNRLLNDEGIPSHTAEIKSYSDYYPFGWQMPSRNSNSDSYRYGFNSHEKDNEVAGSGNHYDFGGMGYDPRVVTRWNTDPMAGKYPFLSPYAVFNNNPIIYQDPDGNDWVIKTTFDNNGNKTVHIKVTAAVINSSATKVDMTKFQAAAKSQIEASYSLKYKETVVDRVEYIPSGLDNYPGQAITIYKEIDVNVVIDVDIRTITDKKDLASNEHLIDIVDDKDITSKASRKKGYMTIGRAPINGKYIKINADATTGIIKGRNKKTVPHELGHTGGLYHPNEGAGFFGYFQSEQHMKDGTHDNNLMYQTGYQKNTLKDYYSDGNELESNQIDVIQRNYDNGKLNKENIPK